MSATVSLLQHATRAGGDALGTLASPSATLEELYLLNRITRHLGSDNIDHRLRQRDFRDQAADPVAPALGCGIAELETQQGIFVIGSNLRMEVPIVAHRIRKAARKGASVAFLNPAVYEYHFRTAAYVEAPLDRFVAELAAVVAAAAQLTEAVVPVHVEQAVKDASIGDAHRAAARALGQGERLILLGHIAQRHPRFAELRSLAAALAALTGAKLGYLAEGANGVGAALAGALPHRGAGGTTVSAPGRDAAAMVTEPRSAYVLFGIEPRGDLADGAKALAALENAKVVCFTAYATRELSAVADILLPIGTFAETAGTFVNAEGRWQSFDAAAEPVGEARPGWRVLRVLGNELGVPACEYRSPSEVTAALEQVLGVGATEPRADLGGYRGSFTAGGAAPQARFEGDLDVPIYAVDAVVRRSEPLQQTRLGRDPSEAV
jgi:NADH-quinone oxidoreductase subunit G